MMKKTTFTKEEIEFAIAQHEMNLVDNVINSSVTYISNGEEVNWAKKRLLEEPAKYHSQLMFAKNALLKKEIAIEVMKKREAQYEDTDRYQVECDKIRDQIPPIEAEIEYYTYKLRSASIGYEKLTGKSYTLSDDNNLKAEWKAKRKA